MGKWEEIRFNTLRDYYISARRRLEWAIKHGRSQEEIEDKSSKVAALKWAVEQAAKAVKEEEL